MLHLEIIQERLEREFDLELITTAPSVVYNVHLTDGGTLELHNPADLPDPVHIDRIEEPWISATIMVPDEYLGGVLKLCEDRRGEQTDLTYSGTRAVVVYRLPLNEVVFDFYDRLKSVSRGYASFDYQIAGRLEGDLVKMSVLVNGQPVDALSIIAHRSNVESRGRTMCEKLKELIPRQLFKVPIQAAIGGKGDRSGDDLGPPQGRLVEVLWAATSPGSASSWKSRRPARNACASSDRSEIPQEAFIEGPPYRRRLVSNSPRPLKLQPRYRHGRAPLKRPGATARA